MVRALEVRERRALDLFAGRRLCRLSLFDRDMEYYPVPQDGQIIGYVCVIVSMCLVKALDMIQIIVEGLRRKLWERLPNLIPGSFFRRHDRSDFIPGKGTLAGDIDLLQLVMMRGVQIRRGNSNCRRAGN